MSKQNKVIPRQGLTEQQMKELDVDGLAEEAYQNGELQAVDMLGNTETIEPLMDEMFTGHEKPLAAYDVLGVVKHLQGRVLTVVDATFTDEKRLKFVKDLVKECFSASSNWLYEMSIRDFEKICQCKERGAICSCPKIEKVSKKK